MIGHLRDLTMNRDGTQNITITVQADFRETFDMLKDQQLDIDIRKHKEKRSLDANAYAWVLMDKIAKAQRITKEEVYQTAIMEIGGVSTIVCVQDQAVESLRAGWRKNGLGWISDTFPSKLDGCTNVILYYGSSTYDTHQMSTLIDYLIDDAKLYGIETDTPATIQRYKDAWEKHHAG